MLVIDYGHWLLVCDYDYWLLAVDYGYWLLVMVMGIDCFVYGHRLLIDLVSLIVAVGYWLLSFGNGF